MLLPISTKEPVWFTPAHYDDLPEVDRRSYQLLVPNRAGKALYRREIRAQGLVWRDSGELLAVICASLDEMFDADAASEHRSLIERFEDEFAKPTDERSDEYDALGEQVDALAQIAQRDCAPYREALADNSYFAEMSPLVAAALFLHGGKGPDVSIELEGDRVTSDSLFGLPDRDQIAIGAHALALLTLDIDTKKNSELPSPTPPDQ